MEPEGLSENYYFGGGGGTFLTGPALCLFFLSAVLILFLPRKYAVGPFLLAGLFIPIGNQIVVGGIHLMLLRCLILIGCVRVAWSVLTEEDWSPGPLNPLDKILILWAISNAVVFTILWHALQAFVNRLGFLYSTWGIYFLLRYWIRDRQDAIRAIKILAAIAVVIAAFMVPEHITGRNSFSVYFGGIAELSAIRNGRVRAQGPFLHPIIAGTFGAMLLPLFVGLWQQGRGHRWWAGSGVVASLATAFASSSGTPVMTVLAGTGALCLWPFRRRMRAIRWGIVASLVLLQMKMKADVWFLIARASVLTGGTGWHRAELIDHFIRHFGDWWLMGTQENAHWGLDMWDSINVYVNAGIEGGLITFILFIALFVVAYRRVGLARTMSEGDWKSEWLIWTLGAALFANTAAFFGIAYFDQSAMGWYALLAMIAAAPAFIGEAPPDLVEAEAFGVPSASELIERQVIKS